MTVHNNNPPAPARLTDFVSLLLPPAVMTPFAAQWRRILAFVVDGALLSLFASLVMLLLATLLKPWLFHPVAALGEWGRIFGFVLALGYFSLGNSRLTGGQTPGKRLLRIRVSDLQGQPISPITSLWRALFPAFVLVMRDISLPAGFTTAVVLATINFVVYSVLWLELYLLVFHRPARQTLHDILCQTVVLSSTSKLAIPPIARVSLFHWVICALGVAGMLLNAALAIAQALDSPRDIARVQQALCRIDGVYAASVEEVEAIDGRPSALVVTVATTRRLDERGTLLLFPSMARALLREYPPVLDHHHIALSAHYGIQFGLSSWAPPVRHVRSLAQLRAIAELR